MNFQKRIQQVQIQLDCLQFVSQASIQLYKELLKTWAREFNDFTGIVNWLNSNKTFQINIAPSRSGLPALTINKISIHSKYDPEKQAGRQVESINIKQSELIFVYGFGFAYHLTAIIKKCQQQKILTIIEDDHLFLLALLQLDQNWIFNCENLFFLRMNDYIKINNFLQNIPLYQLVRFTEYFHFPLKEIFQQKWQLVQNFIYQSIKTISQDRLTRIEFENLWIKNILLNTACIPVSYRAEDLKNSCRGRPVIILGAGPSFEIDIIKLIKIRKKIVIIAVDTILKPMIKRGIEPDFVFTMDSQFYNLWDLPSTLHKNIKIVADMAVYSGIIKLVVENNSENCIFFTTTEHTINNSKEKHALLNHLLKFGIVLPGFDSGGSVATSAFEFAVFLGGNPIILASMDLCYSQGNTHTQGTIFHDYILKNSKYFKHEETYLYEYLIKKPMKKLLNKIGNPTCTSDILLQFRNYFEKRALEIKNVSLYNLTEMGLNIKGFKNLKVMDDLEKIINNADQDIQNTDVARDFYPVSDFRTKDEPLCEFFESLQEDLWGLIRLLRHIMESSDGFNAMNIEKVRKSVNKLYFFHNSLFFLDYLLDRIGVEKNSLQWWRHYCFRLLQTCYYIRKIVVKAGKRLQGFLKL